MPANKTKMAVAGTLKVNGSKRAIVSAGPIPGSTPTKVPTKHPMNPYINVIGSKATANPCIKESKELIVIFT
jgi:hypothetical protein